MKETNLQQTLSVNPLCLGRKSLKHRLEAYYSLIAPDAIADEVEWNRKFDLIYEKYGGNVEGERALAAKLCKKYGTTVRLRLVAVDVDTISEGNDGQRNWESKVPKKEESWYELSEKQQNSGVIDFTSEGFDPSAALTCTQSKVYESNPFVRESSLLDNVAKFPSYLPECDPLQRMSTNQMKRKIHESPSSSQSPQKKSRKVPILTSIASNYEHAGPFSLLYTAHMKKQRIRIMIRYHDCIRSTLTGFLLAFDKHLNMILRDVDEVYTPRVTKVYKDSNYSKSELEYRRRTCIVDGNVKKKNSSGNFVPPMLKVKQRHFHQILVRGDNVVMVWKASTERSAWPNTTISPERSQYLKSTDNAVDNQKTSVGTPGSLLLALQAKQNKFNYKRRH